MVLIPGHYYYVRELTSHDPLETVAQFDGKRWWIVASEVDCDLSSFEPICEMVRSDGEEVKLWNGS